MDAVLNTNDQSKILAMRNIELFNDGSGGTCFLEVISGNLHFSMNFFFDFPSFEEFISALEKMYSELCGEIKLGQQFEKPYLVFKVSHGGRIIVSGFLAVYSDHTQKMEFSFETDQTALPAFISQLKGVCSENAT